MSKKTSVTLAKKVLHKKNELNIHLKTVHENVKVFKRGPCDRSFGLKGHLRTHVKTVHENIKGFKCNVCDIRIRYKGNMEKHFRKVHKNE